MKSESIAIAVIALLVVLGFGMIVSANALLNSDEGEALWNIGLGNEKTLTVKEKTDIHGLMGEKYQMMIFDIPKDRLSSVLVAIESHKKWHALPYNEQVQKIVEGRNTTDGQVGPYLLDKEGKKILPTIEHGYWFFVNQAKAKERILTPEKYYLAVFDKDKNELYFIKTLI